MNQALRSWNIRFDKAIKEFGFIKSPNDLCVYKKLKGQAIIFLVLYVDDILLMGNVIPMLKTTKVWLSRQFLMNDLGEVA